MEFKIFSLSDLYTWHTVSDNNIIYCNRMDEVFSWCESQPSSGGFYFSIHAWYFEYKEDALLFMLRWGS